MCMEAAKERDPEVYGSWLISFVQRYLLVQARMIFQLLVFRRLVQMVWCGCTDQIGETQNMDFYAV